MVVSMVSFILIIRTLAYYLNSPIIPNILIFIFIFICILAYNACPAHINMIAEELSDEVAKESSATPLKLSKKQVAQKRGLVAVGGGIDA